MECSECHFAAVLVQLVVSVAVACCPRPRAIMQAKLLLVAVIVAFVVAVLPSTCEAQGKKPPLIPTEYAANVVQRKWNYNGFGVNNTYNMVMYISRSQMTWRTDTVLAGMTPDRRRTGVRWRSRGSGGVTLTAAAHAR